MEWKGDDDGDDEVDCNNIMVGTMKMKRKHLKCSEHSDTIK